MQDQEHLAAPGGLAVQGQEPTQAAMFDAFLNPRVRYVRVSFEGSHLILSVVEAEAWKREAEASAASDGQTDPHTYSDVYLSDVEADALPEFDGF